MTETMGVTVDAVAYADALPSYKVPSFDSEGVSDSLSPSAVTSFSEVENPFLFPLHLLDATPAGSVCAVAETHVLIQPERLVGDADGPRWWLIHTKPRQEKAIAIELRALDIPHYLPVTKCKALTRGRPRITRAPQFAGYMFLWGNSDQRLSALKTNRIVTTHRIEDQLGLTGQLWALADLIEKGVPLRIEERLVAGQYVRVKSGLLRDKRGVIIKRAGKTRLFVFINELLGGVSLEIEQHLCEPY